MKFLMILAGLSGFSLSLAISLTQESSWPSILARACVSALIVGWLGLWWSRLWLKGLQESNRKRREQAQQEARRKAAAQKAAQSEKSISTTHKP